ncbi:MAG: carbon-nitrogen hydrolase family protein [Aquabacterium sp.]|jgi:nitrilase|uniref:carbon-nitrogen hydrolase family protein n=1 Tax=Aquabacterium sp. TaxID=1872578 RepID=UPI002A35FF11|nr:carbon-nitrogen hydrolase family protein [Aquabacterium sp.]MDX9844120.1 carbon-nitrogen hydrolase family protein [Aquabacterium sp.]
MKAAAIQMISTPRVDDNFTQARSLIAQAAQAGAELVALPEYFCLIGQRDVDKLTIAEPLADADHPATAGTPMQHILAETAKEHGIWLIGGTLPIHAPDSDKVYNTTLVYDPQGHRVARYDKIHLFCFDDGERRYDEATTLRRGHEPMAFTLTDRGGNDWRIGLSICYDLRFPELFRQLGAPQPLDLIVLPAAFTDVTGEAHWELLLRARAVENLCHVLAPAQGGQHENGRTTYGHSMVVGPWGDVLAVQADGPGVVMADLSLSRQQQVRTQLPALQHRVLHRC